MKTNVGFVAVLLSMMDIITGAAAVGESNASRQRHVLLPLHQISKISARIINFS